jgi:lipopolysaccharide/colanic/teichoic acid biosynthesis glycosyltransferase
MTVRMENIDELRRRTNVSYEAAKDALEKCDDNLLEALVYLEKQNMVKPNTTCENKESLWDKFKKLIRKGNNTRFIIRKKEANVLSISVTLAVIITIIAPYVTFFGLIAALFTGHRIKFEGKDFELGKVNKMMDKVAESVDSAKRKMAEDSSSHEGTNQ